jgi:hypothetical protein
MEMVADDADGIQDKVGVGEHGQGGLKRRRADRKASGPTPTTDSILEARLNDLPDHTSGGATVRECYLLLLYYLKGAERKGSTYFPPMFEETTDLDLPAKLRREEVRAWSGQRGKSVHITDEQIDRHAAEVGIERQLGKHMKVRIRRFSELLLALEKLAVVRFDGVLANRYIHIYVSFELRLFSSPSKSFACLFHLSFACLVYLELRASPVLFTRPSYFMKPTPPACSSSSDSASAPFTTSPTYIYTHTYIHTYINT